jgi:hypothetical protein
MELLITHIVDLKIQRLIVIVKGQSGKISGLFVLVRPTWRITSELLYYPLGK